MMRFLARFRRRSVAAAGLAAVVGCLSLSLAVPASAQFWAPWGDRRPQQQPQRQQQYNPFGNFWEPRQQRERSEPTDFSRAPGPSKKADTAAPNQAVVVGDAMADWLGLGR